MLLHYHVHDFIAGENGQGAVLIAVSRRIEAWRSSGKSIIEEPYLVVLYQNQINHLMRDPVERGHATLSQR